MYFTIDCALEVEPDQQTSAGSIVLLRFFTHPTLLCFLCLQIDRGTNALQNILSTILFS
jgi:hypothetical protein